MGFEAYSDGSALGFTSTGGDGPQYFINADLRGTVIVNGKDSLSVHQAGNQIIRDEPGWSGALGAPATVTYGFRATAPATMPDETTGFERFNPTQIVQAELALRAWSDVANISFVRVGAGTSGEGAYTDQATILMADYTTGPKDAAAFAFYPGSTAASSRAGDLWVDLSDSYNVTPTVGNYGGMVLIHELGHTIGLAHPGDYGVEDDATPTYAADAGYYEDSRQYSVMSYFGEANTGGSFQGRYAASPLLDDISAAQQEYGANFSTRTGDTVYGFNSNAERPWFEATSAATKLIFAVWDAGGVDTFDFSGYASNQVIDLRAGYFSSVGGLVGNVSIAQGVSIEIARGGSGADTINGNAASNVIYGGSGQGYLRGNEGNDQIVGGPDFDDINGNVGADTEWGGDGRDWVVGGKDNDLLFGEGGDDIVYGNLGDDTAEGGDGADWVRGGQGDDTIAGGAGADFMSGDRGSDTIAGGAGADVFNIFSGAGLERVIDFSFAEGDRVRIEGGGAYTTSQVGADTVVNLGGGDQMVLAGVQLSSLSDGWLTTA